MKPRLLPCGPTAVIIEVDAVDHAGVLAAALRSRAVAGVIEIVPAARTVLVDCADHATLNTITALVPALDLSADAPAAGALVEIPTTYDGADLAHVAAETGLTVAEVIELHSGAGLRAAFCGFAPGFAYLTGVPEILHLPRRAEPRPQVPAGSVAIAAEFTAVYPTTSPGGWHLLGRTSVPMWDPSRPRPSLIVPGDRVQFVPERR